jgi:hypothetical protein
MRNKPQDVHLGTKKAFGVWALIMLYAGNVHIISVTRAQWIALRDAGMSEEG